MRYLLSFLFICSSLYLYAQDEPKLNTDSLRHADDSIRHPNRYFDSTLFDDANIPTASDYLIAIERMQETLNQVPLVTSTFSGSSTLQKNINEADSAIGVVQEGLSFDIRVLSLRNIQMLQTLVDNLKFNNDKYIETVNTYDQRLDSLKKNLLSIRRDTVLRTLFRTPALRKSFAIQLQPIREKWKNTDSLIRQATFLINNLKVQVSQNDITLKELEYQTDMRLQKMGPRAFTKEVPYLWESMKEKKGGILMADYNKSANNLNAAGHYYFINTRSQRTWLFVGGIVFFVWVFFNYLSVKRKHKEAEVATFHFLFVKPVPIATSFVVMLTLAPLIDVNAPAIYLETVQFVLMIILTIVFYKRWPKDLFYSWCIIIALFLLVPLGNITNLPFVAQRWLMLVDDTAACLFGVYFFRHIYKADLRIRPNLLTAAAFYSLFNLGAAFANIFGRLTLTKILGSTAVYGFAQMISLTVFVRLITEAFLLQILASRIRKNYPSTFDYTRIQTKINRAATLLSIVLWLIVFFTNLNLFDTLTDELQTIFLTPRQIGSYNFTFWEIVLFIGIIWLANALQKYIAYFFGDTGDDTGIDHHGSRSRLLITRLILLTSGFFLAVVASGLPVDKITVILGALSVGIGLGLQNIVSNFVSGVILIFDRPLRIGDVVELGDKKGRVKEIGIRASTLLTPDGAEVIIPNGDILSKNIVNWTLTNNQIRATITFSIESLPDDVDMKSDIISIITANSNVVKTREPFMMVNNIAAKSIQLSFMFWCIDVTRIDAAKSEVWRDIFKYLRTKNITIV